MEACLLIAIVQTVKVIKKKKKVELVSVKNKNQTIQISCLKENLSKTLLKMEFVFNAIKKYIFVSNSTQALY